MILGADLLGVLSCRWWSSSLVSVCQDVAKVCAPGGQPASVMPDPRSGAPAEAHAASWLPHHVLGLSPLHLPSGSALLSSVSDVSAFTLHWSGKPQVYKRPQTIL